MRYNSSHFLCSSARLHFAYGIRLPLQRLMTESLTGWHADDVQAWVSHVLELLSFGLAVSLLINIDLHVGHRASGRARHSAYDIFGKSSKLTHNTCSLAAAPSPAVCGSPRGSSQTAVERSVVVSYVHYVDADAVVHIGVHNAHACRSEPLQRAGAGGHSNGGSGLPIQLIAMQRNPATCSSVHAASHRPGRLKFRSEQGPVYRKSAREPMCMHAALPAGSRRHGHRGSGRSAGVRRRACGLARQVRSYSCIVPAWRLRRALCAPLWPTPIGVTAPCFVLIDCYVQVQQWRRDFLRRSHGTL